MQANELRIGNLVNDADSPIAEVKELHGDESIWLWDMESDYYEQDYSKVKPINLSEEWLLKLGFEQVTGESEGSMAMMYGNLIFHRVEFGCLDIMQIMDDDRETIYTTELIKYVHQLQNLYFALTGEELSIKDVK